jgi:uncharacterized membrane protein
MRFNRGTAPVPSSGKSSDGQVAQQGQPEHVAETVAEVVELEGRSRIGMTFSDQIADYITRFAGSMVYVWLHVVWFSVWIIINLPALGIEFDPYPFGLLTMIVSLEAIFLSTFVLISQNRQALHADKRAKLDLQVNVISEREITKLMELVSDIHEHLNGAHEDAAVKQMREQTSVSDLADAVDAAEQTDDPEASKGPDSAVDTEA